MKAKVFKILEIVFMSIMGLIILILGIFIIQRLINKDKPVMSTVKYVKSKIGEGTKACILIPKRRD